MFEHALLETSVHAHRRSTAAAASVALQAGALAIFVVLPMLYIESLPKLEMHTSSPIFTSPTPQVTTHPVQAANTSHAADIDNRFTFHPPTSNKTAIEDVQPPSLPGSIQCAHDCPPMSPLFANAVITSPLPTLHQSKPLVVSHLAEGQLLYRVQPVYPEIAKRLRSEGTVELRALISRGGAIENIEVISGPPLLVRAAVDAVSQWRYRPYFLNGQVQKVQTFIEVRFHLDK